MHTPQTAPLISEALLTELANPSYAAQLGEFDADTRALLSTALPEICNELLARRKSTQGRSAATNLALQWEAIAARLEKARATIRQAGPVTHADLTEACKTLQIHSTDPAERTAAAEVLSQLHEAA